jgi:predicted nucleic acid-binding protein
VKLAKIIGILASSDERKLYYSRVIEDVIGKGVFFSQIIYKNFIDEGN